jgi:hypothetical protein
VHAYDLHVCAAQVLAQMIDIHAQTSAGEVRLLVPQLSEDKIAVNSLIDVSAQDKQQVALSGRQVCLA